MYIGQYNQILITPNELENCAISHASWHLIYYNNIFNRVAGGRVPIRSEPYGRGGAYEYIRRIHDHINSSTANCLHSEHEE